MQRIYCPNTTFSEALTLSDTEIYHQLTRVMRARVGQMVIFFDGENQVDHQYEIINIDKKKVDFTLHKQIEKKSEISPELTLYQALPNKLSKLEFIIQKCSEIWYKKIVFFDSQRSQKLVLSDNKKQRLSKIAIEAIEQCGGNIVPEIEFVALFSFERERIQERVIAGEQFFICHTQGSDSQSLWDIRIEDKANIIVGPEGGFSEEEIHSFISAGVQKVFFWNRILRCETVWEVLGFYLSQKKES